MKAYTDLDQSRKLAEMLPLESADMHWQYIEEDNGQLQWFYFPKDFSINQHDNIPCWSLAALLGVINKDYYTALYHDGVAWNFDVTHHDNETDKHNTFADTPVDACVEMINKLHEQKIL